MAPKDQGSSDDEYTGKGRIPMLKGESNYKIWRIAIEEELCDKDLDDYVDGTALAPDLQLPPGQDDKATVKTAIKANSEYKKWQKKEDGVRIRCQSA